MPTRPRPPATDRSPGTTRPIGQLVITPRALADYRDMFVLSDDDLYRGPILDCPGGASPFGAQVRARGGSAVSVDPVYALPTDELMRRIGEDIQRTAAWVASQRETIHWPYVGTADAMRRAFELAADLFAMDYARDGKRYVAAALPRLPFEDRQFAMALCSHLIFCYPEYLDVETHVASLLELVRVTDGDVRVFPLVDTTATRYPHLDDVRAALADHGVTSDVRTARCAWQRGGDQLFVCWRETGPGRRPTPARSGGPR